MPLPHYAYDVFISHNRADKDWARRFADWAADQEYNGRNLRPWLDERNLDPGKLGSEAELTTALDRSRCLCLALSPESLASSWVAFELEHFLSTRSTDDIIPIRLRDCSYPEPLQHCRVFDLPDLMDHDDQLREILAKLCPPTDVAVVDVQGMIDLAVARIEASDPGGFAPGPTSEKEEFFSCLMQHDIDDGGSEGLAIAGFLRAAEHLDQLYRRGSTAAYNFKMLLGECLAAALRRSTGYRQVAQQYLDVAERQGDDPVLLFVVARAYSKLAEVDRRLIDASVLLRAAFQLDARQPISNEARAIEILIGRTLAKIRDEPLGELVIKTLSEGGRASRMAALAAISLSYDSAAPVAYLAEFEQLRRDGSRELAPPSRRLLGELFAIGLDQDTEIQRTLQTARAEISRNYPGAEFPYGSLWFIDREPISPADGHNMPFAGTLVRATLDNMVTLAEEVSVATVACLTEPRVVDGLFSNSGAIIIPMQDVRSPQCRRLQGRNVPFAMVSDELMARLSDGDHIIVRPDRVERLQQ